MSADAVRAAVEAFNQGDLATYEAAFAPEAMRVIPGIPDPVPVAASVAQLGDLRSAFEGLRLDAALMLDTPPYVVVRWVMTGTHTGDLYGLAPTGRSISVESCEIYEFDNGRVIRSWAYGDPAGLIAQLTEGTAP